MKRIIKNIISIVMIILICLGMYFTMNYAKEHITVNQINQNIMGDNPLSMNNKEESSETPPEKPSGEMNENDGNPPEKPDGENTNNEKPEMPSNSNMTSFNQNTLDIKYYVVFGTLSLVLSSIMVYLIMSNFNKKTFKETFVNSDKIVIGVLSVIILTCGLTYLNSKITKEYFINNSSDINKGQSNNLNYSGVNQITDDTNINSGEYTSSESDENALLISGEINVTLSDITVNKTGDSDGGDNTSFYGTNSAIIAKDGANLILKNINVTTDADGANGVFSYGGSATTNNSSSDGTTVTISDSKITTTKDNSGGIMTTGGGNMNASNLTITTSGTSSAAIRSDRGGGNVNVDGGTYTTNGMGSPTIYSTAEITVKNAKLISNASEGIIIEGKNSVTIDNVTLEDSNTKLNGKSTTYKNIFLYQSMSGDADNGNAEFTAKDSKITTNNGDTFYITNTSASITLENNTIINKDESGNFLRIQKDSWGTSGNNGGDVTLNCINQDINGNIVVDSISKLNMFLKTNSYFEGAINNNNAAKEINLTLDKNSKIKLTNDSYITSLDNEDTTNSNIDFNGYSLYVNGTKIN